MQNKGVLKKSAAMLAALPACMMLFAWSAPAREQLSARTQDNPTTAVLLSRLLVGAPEYPGTTFHVRIRVESNSRPISAYVFVLEYDSDSLDMLEPTVMDGTPSDALGIVPDLTQPPRNPGRQAQRDISNVDFAGTTNFTAGTLMTIPFFVKSSATYPLPIVLRFDPVQEPLLDQQVRPIPTTLNFSRTRFLGASSSILNHVLGYSPLYSTPEVLDPGGDGVTDMADYMLALP